MPYASNQDLPHSVRDHLPAHAQDIFRSAFNAAWHTYGEADPAHFEVLSIALTVAALTVERSPLKASCAESLAL
jgi:cation transport regulator